MPTLLELAELEPDDSELVPEILPVDARLAFEGIVSEFEQLVSQAVAIAPSKELLEGSSFIQLEALESSEVRVLASDGEQTVSTSNKNLKVRKEGHALLPGKKLLEILRKAPSDTFTFLVMANTARITIGRARWTLQTPSGDVLRHLPDLSASMWYQMPSIPLLKALAATRRAVAVTGSRAALQQVAIMDGSVIACDGARLHKKQIPDFPENLKINIPTKSIDELIKLLRSVAGEDVSISSSKNLLAIKTGNTVLVSQRLLLPFPDVESMMLSPAMMNKQSLVFNVSEFQDALNRVRVNSDPEYSSVFLSVVKPSSEDWALSISARDRYGNAAQEIIAAQWGGTESQKFCFNHHYLSDLLISYARSEVELLMGVDTKVKKSPLFLNDAESGFVGLIQQSSAH